VFSWWFLGLAHKSFDEMCVSNEKPCCSILVAVESLGALLAPIHDFVVFLPPNPVLRGNVSSIAM
jgi:hypothetical protein